MTEEQKKIIAEDGIIRAIQTAPEEDVPFGFHKRVMDRLEPKKVSAWTRLRLWFVKPRVMVFKPLQVVPAMVMVVALLALAVIKMDGPAPETGVRLTAVRFVLHDGNMQARNVSVIGTFNNWQAERSVMWYNREARSWILEAQLPPGDHEYLFLVNGERLVADPMAPMTRDDGFGNQNSIMFVNGENEQSI